MIKAPLCATIPSFAINVGIFFSVNEYNRRFFVEQLLPFYKDVVPKLAGGKQAASSSSSSDSAKLQSLISPTIIPWGTTRYDANSSPSFTCVGANECYANRLFACADYFHGTEPRARLHLVEFALCFFVRNVSLEDVEAVRDVAKECANLIWIPDPFPQLDDCATGNTTEAVNIYLRMKEKTENNHPALTSCKCSLAF